MAEKQESNKNIKSKDDKCFQYAVNYQNYQNINNRPESVNNINPFIDQCNWSEIDFPSHKKD